MQCVDYKRTPFHIIIRLARQIEGKEEGGVKRDGAYHRVYLHGNSIPSADFTVSCSIFRWFGKLSLITSFFFFLFFFILHLFPHDTFLSNLFLFFHVCVLPLLYFIFSPFYGANLWFRPFFFSSIYRNYTLTTEKFSYFLATLGKFALKKKNSRIFPTQLFF